MAGVKVRAVRPTTDSWIEVNVPDKVARFFLKTNDVQYIITWVGETFGWQFIPMEFFYEANEVND
jgi:hypothetical protein